MSWSALSGWAEDPEDPTRPATLTVTVDGVFAGEVVANRPQTKPPKGCSGDRCGFQLRFGPDLASAVPHLVQVKSAATDEQLKGSPWALRPATQLDETFRKHVARVISSAPPDEELDETIRFLATETTRLLQRRADTLSHKRRRQDHRLFRRRWSPDPAQSPDILPYETRRALFVVGKFPSPDHAAPLVARLAGLTSEGFEVSLAAADMVATSGATAFEPHGVQLYSKPFCASVEELFRMEQHSFDVICFADAILARLYGPLARQVQHRARLLVAADRKPPTAAPAE